MKKSKEACNINFIAISICTLMVLVSAFGLENFFRIIRGAFRDNYFPRDILEIEREAIIIFLLCLICLLFVWLGTKKRWLVIVSLLWSLLCLLPLFELNYYSFLIGIWDIWHDPQARALNWRSLKLSFNYQWYFAVTFILMICLCIAQSINLWGRKKQDGHNTDVN